MNKRQPRSVAAQAPGFEGQRAPGAQYAQLGLHSLFTAWTFNEAQIHLNRTSLLTDTANQQPLSISLLPGRAMGAAIQLSGDSARRVGRGRVHCRVQQPV